jgi:hypothetical protein
MTLDNWKDTWQTAEEETESDLSDEALLRLVKETSEQFDEKIRRRDRREGIAAALVFLFFSTMLLTPSWMVRIGALIVMGWSASIYWILHRARTGYAPPDPKQPVAAAVRTELEKVNEQIRLLERIFWWYLLPPAVGLFLVVGGNAGFSWFTPGYGTSIVALGGGIYYLNQREVRNTLRPRQEELTRLLRQMEGE